MGAGLRPDAKAPEQPPDPKAGAPVLDSTAKKGRAAGKPTAARTQRNAMEERYAGLERAVLRQSLRRGALRGGS